ncbi:dihydrofolate reductase family protein [Microbacterium tenebrionis]|uniref:dihydrofolate reductase family protein n=1 Tax=Microbacterium tenebrionis TaxID=2830665 RepID=UPI00158E7357|nr:dihydrofolate reductase family protein [Microbacterium ihumii]
MTAAAGDKDIWIVGGGDLAGQFVDAGLLDEVWLQYAPVTLGSGAPVLPRSLDLELIDVARNRAFLCGDIACSALNRLDPWSHSPRVTARATIS